MKFLDQPLINYASLTSFKDDFVGQVSDDFSAVVGFNNWCFIYNGSNSYRDAYTNEDIAYLGDKWAELIERRQRICELHGVKFVQIVVPNKATLLTESFPEPLGNGITKILQRLQAASPNANFICPVESWREIDAREAIFRRNDSHLTVAGNSLLAQIIIENSDVSLVDFSFIEVCKVNHLGDLGCKFKIPIFEDLYAPRFDVGLLDQSNIFKTHEVIVNGFNGTQQYFYNPCAPIKLSVLVFGNSFFERVPSWGLSPLFAALFERFYFIWSPSFDENKIEELKPDIVVSQTCERFLNKLPEYF